MTTKMGKIEIFGPDSILTGDYPILAVKQVTSYPVEGAQWSPSFRKGQWDGRKHLFRPRFGSFPTGLVTIVKEKCEELGYSIELVDHRELPKASQQHSAVGTFDLVGIKFEYPFEYQLDAANEMIAKRQGIVKIATNGGKTEIACAVTQFLGIKTMFVVSTVELLYQARERFKLRLGVGDEEIGIVGNSVWEPGSWVTIATVGTLESRMDSAECQDLVKGIELLFLDECHHLGSETWFDVCTLCPAYYRYGLSGTPLDRTDGANLRLIAATGDVIVNISNKFLVDRGVSARAHIIFDKVTAPSMADGKKYKYPTVYKKCVVENEHLLAKVVEWTKIFRELNLGTLILCEELAQGRAIDDALWTKAGETFIPHQFINGEEDPDVRRQALSDFGDGSLPVLVASTILDEGVDVPTIDALILAGSRKSRIRTMQRLGRGLRGSKLIVVEFANYCHDFLLEHSKTRLEDYKAEECFPIHSSKPNKALVEKIWYGEDTRTKAK